MDKDDTTPESYITEQMVELRRKYYDKVDGAILDSYINLQIRKGRRWVGIIAVSFMIPFSVFAYQYTQPSGPPLTDCAIVAAVTEFPKETLIREKVILEWQNLSSHLSYAPSDMMIGKSSEKICIAWRGVTTCFGKDKPSEI